MMTIYEHLVLILIVSLFGTLIGFVISHHIIWERLEKAGISRLVEHETTVDGIVTTNWVEIVWKDKMK